MRPERRQRILAFNRRRAEEGRRAADLETLLHALPPGQVKQLMKDETCAAILERYGITG